MLETLDVKGKEYVFLAYSTPQTYTLQAKNPVVLFALQLDCFLQLGLQSVV